MKFAFSLVISALLAFASAQQNGDIRLEGDTLSRGRLEVFLNGRWGTICFDHYSSQEGVAQAACRQLGYNDYKEVNTVDYFGIPEGTVPILLHNMYCRYQFNQLNAPQHVLRCDYFSGSGFCQHRDDMAIECQDTGRDSYTYDTMVDILNEDIDPSSSVSSGFAQVYVNNRWGPVCNMEKADADSFCRQLSYTGAVGVYDTTNTTSDRDEVLDSFKCSSSQSCLRRCFSYPQEDAEVDCANSYSFVTCTFDTSDEYFSSYGSQSTCTLSNGALIAGAVVGSLLAVGFFLALGVVLCCCIPGCLCHHSRRRKVYTTTTTTASSTKYSSI